LRLPAVKHKFQIRVTMLMTFSRDKNTIRLLLSEPFHMCCEPGSWSWPQQVADAALSMEHKADAIRFEIIIIIMRKNNQC